MSSRHGNNYKTHVFEVGAEVVAYQPSRGSILFGRVVHVPDQYSMTILSYGADGQLNTNHEIKVDNKDLDRFCLNVLDPRFNSHLNRLLEKIG